MQNENSRWFLAPSDHPADRLGRLLVERKNLSPPVDVMAELRQVADVEEIAWLYNCDAIVTGLGVRRPKVFLKSGLWKPRRNFTVAHEWAHIMLSWHTGQPACTPDQVDWTAQDMGRTSGEILSSSRISEQESEAQRFSGNVLLPYRWALETAIDEGLTGMFSTLPDTGMSAIAVALSLREYLQPGFVLTVERAGGDFNQVLSRGTVTPRRDSGTEMEDLAKEHGSVEISGKMLYWHRLVELEDDTAMPEDDRDTQQILRDAIHQATDDPNDELYRRINGMIAGKLSKPRSATVEGMMMIVKHHLENQDIDPRILSSMDFRLFLLRRTHARSAKLSQ